MTVLPQNKNKMVPQKPDKSHIDCSLQFNHMDKAQNKKHGKAN